MASRRKSGVSTIKTAPHMCSRERIRVGGFDVIYSELYKALGEIVLAAALEDVDVLDISILSGARDTLVPRFVDKLKEYAALKDTLVIVGGIIPDENLEELLKLGIAKIFDPGASMQETIDFVRTLPSDSQS